MHPVPPRRIPMHIQHWRLRHGTTSTSPRKLSSSTCQYPTRLEPTTRSGSRNSASRTPQIGAVLTEMYTHAEHLQKNTEVKTRLYNFGCATNCCTGVLEANLNSNVIGVAHIGWISRDVGVNSQGPPQRVGQIR